ncbi:MAG: TOBE domain-containing protein [Candidatus Accumulibacter sp.]|jgi:molybdate transport system regulatory protein|nr:TOBE domain-containing protein [Accumulibacter sp.]
MQRRSEPSRQVPHRLTGRLEIETERGLFLGDIRVRLLEAIAVHGSISKAARFVPMSYKAAWDAVDAMSNLADQPLVTRVSGGRSGGGTQLTDYGHRVVSFYRALEAEYQSMLERLAASMDRGEASSFAEFHRLLRRMSVQTSARNQFVGTIVGLKADEVDYEVILKPDEIHELVAVVTRESAESLGLKMDMEIQALIKAPFVQILADGEEQPPSLRNCLPGVVERLHRGGNNTEVVLILPGGKIVCAVIPNERADLLALVEGSPARAVFAASSVILCIPA